MADVASDPSDPRWKEYTATEQKASRDMLMFGLWCMTIVVFFLLIVILKDYFALKNICCVIKQKGSCGTFLTRPIYGLLIGMYSVIIGICVLNIDMSNVEYFITGIICSGLGFFAIVFSIINLRRRLYTNRHKELQEIWSSNRRNDILNTLKTVKDQIIIPFTRD